MKIRVYLYSVSTVENALKDFALTTDDMLVYSDDESVIVETAADDDSAIAAYDWLREKFTSFMVYAGIDTVAERVGKVLSATENKLVTAESCTAGLVSGTVADVPGSSDWLWGGYITYDNLAKVHLGVDKEILDANGAVSSPVAALMAEKALENSDASVAVSITGIAGPGGGSREKPVGTVWFGIAGKNKKTSTFLFKFSGDRMTVRKKTVISALLLVENFVQDLTLFPYCE